MGVKRFSIEDPNWYQAEDRQIFLGDVVDAANSDTMSVGFARYDKGTANEWTVTYDEVLIVTKGVFTVRSEEDTETAKAGEVIFLTADTKVVYQAKEETELVYVTYPHWLDAQRDSAYADLLDTFHPA